MRSFVVPLSVAAMCYFPFLGAVAAPPQPPRSLDGNVQALTLARALTLAEAANPDLRNARAQREQATGELADASALLYNNPTLDGQRVRREGNPAGAPGERWNEWSAGISQTFEVAGQRGFRRKAAELQLDAVDASIEATRRAVLAQVELAFVEVLALQRRLDVERQSQRLAEDAASYVGKRVAAGEDSRLDGNLARVEAERARNQIGALEEQLLDARQELSRLLQLPPAQLPAVAGELVTPLRSTSLLALLASAAGRPELHALNLREASVRQRLSLERAARYPDVTVGVQTGREGAPFERERFTGVTLSVPLPLFRRNAAGIGRAATELGQAQAAAQAAERDGAASLQALWQKQQSLAARVDTLERTVLPALEENQQLSVKSLHAGEIGLAQLVLVNRQVLDGRRDLVDAQAQLRQTRIALARAAGMAMEGDRP